MLGTTTPSGHINISIGLNSASFVGVAQWNSTTGTIRFGVPESIHPYDTFFVQFSVSNPTSGQQAQNVGIAGYMGSINILGRAAMQNAGGNAAPLLVAGFVTKLVAQSNVSASSLNTITVTFSTYSASAPSDCSTRSAASEKTCPYRPSFI